MKSTIFKQAKRTRVVSAFFLFALFWGGIGTWVRATDALPDDPLEGRRWFEEKSCFRCHGLDRSELAGGPALAEGRFRGSFLDLGAALWNHAPQMDASFEMSGLSWPELNDEQAQQLLVFLYFVDYLGRPGDPDTGARIFRQQGCSSCHNLGGGRSRLGPDLSSLKSHSSPLAVAQEIWNHGPSMLQSMQLRGIRPPHFDAGDLADLSAFIRQQAGPQPRRPLLLAPGNPNAGAALFSEKGCARCHGRTGQGGSNGPDLTQFDLQVSAEAIAGTMWNHSLEMNRSMQSLGVRWPRFQDSELADLVAFLYFLPFSDSGGNPERGRETFARQSCATCHSGKARQEDEMPIGPDLTQGLKDNRPSALVAAMWNHAPIMKKAILRKGNPWPDLTGKDLRDLLAYLSRK